MKENNIFKTEHILEVDYKYDTIYSKVSDFIANTIDIGTLSSLKERRITASYLIIRTNYTYKEYYYGRRKDKKDDSGWQRSIRY